MPATLKWFLCEHSHPYTDFSISLNGSTMFVQSTFAESIVAVTLSFWGMFLVLCHFLAETEYMAVALLLAESDIT